MEKLHLLGAIVAIGTILILALMSMATFVENIDETTVISQSHNETSSVSRQVINPLWPNPAIVVGLPKAGTQSLYDFFRCGGYKNVSHYGDCHPKRMKSKSFCGLVIKNNVLAGVDPLLNTGNWDLYAQVDVTYLADGRTCFYPQMEALDEIHKYHPNSTFILNTRNASHWLGSVKRWHGMQGRLIRCNLPDLPAGTGKKDEDMLLFHEKQNERVRDFCKRYPSHTLVEIDVESNTTGKVLEEAFGISSRCWGKNDHRGGSVMEKSKKKGEPSHNST